MDVAASECDLSIVHNVDATAWKDYIVRLANRFVTKKGVPPLRIDSVDDSALTKTRHPLPSSAIVIVILSPAHLDFLRSNYGFSYRTLIDTHATDKIVLRCGVACFDDLADQDKAVFTQFFGWNKLEDIENGEPVTKAIGAFLSRRSVRDATPAEVSSPLAVVPRLHPSSGAPTNNRLTTTAASSDNVFRSHRGPSSPTVHPNSSTGEQQGNHSSNRASSGYDSVYVETSNDASMKAHFRVIPETIRCEVRSLHARVRSTLATLSLIVSYGCVTVKK